MIVVHPTTPYPGAQPAIIGFKARVCGRQIGMWCRVPRWVARLAMRFAGHRMIRDVRARGRYDQSPLPRTKRKDRG